MASYLSLLCEGCHSNRLMQGSPKEKKRQRQSRKGLGKTIEPRATGQICRLGHNRWSFFNRQAQLLQATCAAVPCSNDLMHCLHMIQPMVKARAWSPDTGLIFFLLGDLVYAYEGGGIGGLGHCPQTHTQSNWIACVVIATPITNPLHGKCARVQRSLERIQEDSSLFFRFVRGPPHKRRNDWKLIETGSALVKKKTNFRPSLCHSIFIK